MRKPPTFHPDERGAFAQQAKVLNVRTLLPHQQEPLCPEGGLLMGCSRIWHGNRAATQTTDAHTEAAGLWTDGAETARFASSG